MTLTRPFTNLWGKTGGAVVVRGAGAGAAGLVATLARGGRRVVEGGLCLGSRVCKVRGEQAAKKRFLDSSLL